MYTCKCQFSLQLPVAIKGNIVFAATLCSTHGHGYRRLKQCWLYGADTSNPSRRRPLWRPHETRRGQWEGQHEHRRGHECEGQVLCVLGTVWIPTVRTFSDKQKKSEPMFKYDMTSTKYEVWSKEYGLWSMKYKIWNMRCEVWHMKYEFRFIETLWSMKYARIMHGVHCSLSLSASQIFRVISSPGCFSLYIYIYTYTCVYIFFKTCLWN